MYKNVTIHPIYNTQNTVLVGDPPSAISPESLRRKWLIVQDTPVPTYVS